MRYSLVNYASTLAYQAPSFALPVIVLVHVDSDVNASFYVAWGITAIAFYVPMAIGQALLAEGGKQGSSLAGQVRLALTLAVGLLTIATAGAWLVRDIVVSVYGEEYREAGEILPMLVGAGIPWAITSVYLTEARVRHQHAATVLITLVLSLGVLVPALILVPSDGLDGAAVSLSHRQPARGSRRRGLPLRRAQSTGAARHRRSRLPRRPDPDRPGRINRQLSPTPRSSLFFRQ